MKPIIVLAIASTAVAVTGCATQGDVQVAQATCKVAPVTIASVAGARPRQVDPLDQRWAEMKLASSDYRFQQLHRNGPFNATEEALRDCDRAR